MALFKSEEWLLCNKSIYGGGTIFRLIKLWPEGEVYSSVCYDSAPLPFDSAMNGYGKR